MCIKSFRLILLFLSASLILLHSIIPHQHYAELDNKTKNEVYAEAEGIIDYIKLMFLSDLGEGHMETFDQGKGIDLNLDFQYELVPDISVLIDRVLLWNYDNDNFNIIQIYVDDVPITRQYFLSHIDFRGPPNLS